MLHIGLALSDGGRDANGQGVGRHFHAIRHDGIGAHRGAGIDHGVMEHHRPRSDQAAVFQDAALEVSDMTDDAAFPDNGRKARAGVDHRAVLHRRPGTDGDGAVVAPQHRGRPDRRLGADGHVADHDRVGMHIGLRVDLRGDAIKLIDRHGDRR